MDAEIPEPETHVVSGEVSEESSAPAEPESARAAPIDVRVLAGLEAGVVGGAAMLAWFAADSWLRREYIWRMPHLYASAFYGDRIFKASFGVVTVSGMALLLAMAGCVGILFGLMMARPKQPVRLITAALLTSMSWYWFSQVVIWRTWIPLVSLYLSPFSMVVAHVLYGLLLIRYATRVRALARALGPRSY